MSIRTSFSPLGGGGKRARKITVTISTNQNSINIASLAGNPADVVEITVNIAGTRIIGATSTSTYAITTGNLKAGSTVIFNIAASATVITGAGGAGSAKQLNPAGAGGSGINLTVPVTINNYGTIQGGGGGGRGNSSGTGYPVYYYGGGGGAGLIVGAGGVGTNGTGNSGSISAGGAGYAGGGASGYSGGNPGVAGGGTATYPGGAAGVAIVTNGYAITWTRQGTIKGAIA